MGSLTLLGSALAAPLGGVTLAAAPPAADVAPSGTATFVVTLTNEGLVKRNVALRPAESLPPGWNFSAEPDRLQLAPGANNTTALRIFAPANAAVGSTITLLFEANDTDFERDLSDPLPLNVTVVAPGGAGAPAPPRAPDLLLSAGAVTVDAGQVATSTLRLVTSEPTLQVALGFAAHAWSPRFKDGITVYTLLKDQPKDVTVYADVPPGTADGTVQTLRIGATANGFSFEAPWEVRVRAPAAGDAPGEPVQQTGGADAAGGDGPGDAGDGAATADGAGGPGSSTGGASASPGLSVSVLADPLEVGPGETATATVRVANTGGTALRVTLRGDAGDGAWPVAFDDATLDLAPGTAEEVPMRVTAPGGIFPGGTSAGAVHAVADGGLARTATFAIRIVPATHFDADSTAAATAAPAAGGGAVVAAPVPAAVWLAAGVGSIGAGALLLARRPVRETLLWGAFGMYTRLLQPDILGHPERERLHRLVEQQPGIHFHALQRELAWNTGTLTYHLRVLERHNLVVSRRDGHYRRFFVVGAAPRREAMNADKPTGLRADVLEAVRSSPGISQSDLALALGANKQTVNYHVKALERQGALRIEKRGRETFLYADAPGIGPSGPGRARA